MLVEASIASVNELGLATETTKFAVEQVAADRRKGVTDLKEGTSTSGKTRRDFPLHWLE